LEFLQHYVWKKTIKEWNPRQAHFSLGRLYFTNSIVGKLYYLDLLLTIVLGLESYKDLWTIDGHLYKTFREGCLVRELLENATR